MKSSSSPSRKQLLIAESEVNRALLLSEYQALESKIYNVTQPIKRVAGLMVTAITVIGIWRSMQERRPRVEAPRQSGLLSTLLRLGLGLWMGYAKRRL